MSEEDSGNHNVIGLVMLVVCLAPFAFLYWMSRPSDEEKAADKRESQRRAVLQGKEVQASFTSTNKQLGTWSLSATGCLAGVERGFEGVVFTFANDSPVEEIRVDDARAGDNVVEVRLADKSGTAYRVRERECESIQGRVEAEYIDVNGRPMRQIAGEVSFACAKEGLAGKAVFDGCLP